MSEKNLQQFVSKHFRKQKQTQSFEQVQDVPDEMISQPVLGRHENCDQKCLDFVKISIPIHPQNQKVTPIPLVDLYQAFVILKTAVDALRLQKQPKIKRKIQKKQLKHIKRNCLSSEQRKNINSMKSQGYHQGVIAGQLGISLGQVKMNELVMKKVVVKKEIQFTQDQKTWILAQTLQEVNKNVFSSFLFLNAFKREYPQHIGLSQYQFRKLLHQLKVRYRIPQLKPLTFFSKIRIEQTHRFIERFCSYYQQKYSFIFIDECNLGTISKHSQKQWIIEGAFKQQINRVSNFKCMMAAIGEHDFIRYQLISGTGKSYIFREFLYQIILAATSHYQSSKFVLVFDNCTIHTSKSVNHILEQVHYIFTPPYRPEFNGIEHFFSWLKRRLAIEQPLMTNQFTYQVHQQINKVTAELIDSWCSSMMKQMLSELIFLD